MFIRPLIRFLGFRIRLLYFKYFGRDGDFKSRNSSDEPSEYMLQDFTNALIGLVGFVIISFLLIYLYELIIN